MIEIRCPDGSVAQFPERTSDEAIATALRRQFPAPRPTSLGLGEWAHRANGASINLSASMRRFIIYNGAGTPCGFRQTLDEAVDCADALPPLPPPRVAKPAPAPLTSTASESQIAHDIDLHIRQTEVQGKDGRGAHPLIERPSQVAWTAQV